MNQFEIQVTAALAANAQNIFDSLMNVIVEEEEKLKRVLNREEMDKLLSGTLDRALQKTLASIQVGAKA